MVDEPDPEHPSAPAGGSSPDGAGVPPGAGKLGKSSGVLAKLNVGKGTAWTIGGYAISNALRLAGNLVLTRLLFPEAFGLMALINVVIQGLMLFTDLGISPCIIQHERGEEPRFLNTAYAIQNMRGIALTVGCAALTYPVVLFYESTDPLARELLWYLPVAGCSALIDGFVSTRLFSARRHLQWAKITKLEIASQVAALVVMVAWAGVAVSVWALVAGRLASSLTRTALSYLYLDGIRNRPTWDPAAAKQLFHFGKWIFVSTLLTFMASQVDRLMLGKVVDLKLLGVYGIAANMAMLPTGALVKLGEKVFFPVFSRLKSQPQQLLSAVGRVRIPLLLCAGALIGALIPGGPALIDFLYDDRYLEAGWILQVLLIGAWFKILESPQGAIMLATGRTGWLAIGNAIKLVAIAALLPLGWFKGGLLGAVLGLAAADGLKYLYSVIAVKRLGVSVLLRDVLLSLLLALGVALGALVALAVEQPFADLHRWVRQLGTLALAGGTGAVLWVPALVLWWRGRKRG